jgi:hypothetical protein
MSNDTAEQVGPEMRASREKTWDEMSDTERIAKLRRELRSALMRLHDMQEIVGDLGQHQHGALGQLLKPIADGFNRPQGRGYRDPLK